MSGMSDASGSGGFSVWHRRARDGLWTVCGRKWRRTVNLAGDARVRPRSDGMEVALEAATGLAFCRGGAAARWRGRAAGRAGGGLREAFLRELTIVSPFLTRSGHASMNSDREQSHAAIAAPTRTWIVAGHLVPERPLRAQPCDACHSSRVSKEQARSRIVTGSYNYTERSGYATSQDYGRGSRRRVGDGSHGS